MHYSAIVLLAALAAESCAHGVVTEIQGANGVNMPGLSVIDGTPRDSGSPFSGAEDDTSIIRDRELGDSRASALGRTAGGGPVDAASAIATFMNGADTAGGAATGKRGLLDSLFGGGGGGDGGANGAVEAQGKKTADGTAEAGVSKAAGTGASSGLPTCSDNGTVSVTYHQVNQDGAGPLTADIDPTSGGTDPAAFQQAQVTQDVPGIALGLSATSATDFPVKIQMPAGMTCSGTVGDVKNVCVARIRNSTPAGPFGGSVAFTQSSTAKKRAIEYSLRKRHFARGVLGKLHL